MKKLYAIFLIPSNVLNFLSGIFVATAINILTSPLPQSLLTLQLHLVLAAICFLVCSAFFMAWTVQVSPLHDVLSEQREISDKELGVFCIWLALLARPETKKTVRCLRLTSIAAFVFFIAGLILLGYPTLSEPQTTCSAT